MSKFVVILVATTLLCDASVLKESCSTSGVKEGLCVKLRECPSICAMSKDFSTPMTVERLNYLIESMCGYADKSPKVCCPIKEVMSKQEESNSETTTSMLMRDEMTNSSQMGDEMTNSSQMGDEMTNSSQMKEESTTATSEQTGETTTNSNEIR